MINYWLGVTLRIALILALTVIGFFTLYFTIPLIYPFIIGWILAMVLEPVVSFAKARLGIPRFVSVLTCLFLLIGSFFTFFILLIAEIIKELGRFSNALPFLVQKSETVFVEAITQENGHLKNLIDIVQDYFVANPLSDQHITDMIQNNIDGIVQTGTSMITEVFHWIAVSLGDLPWLMMVFVFIILSTFFISVDWPGMKAKISKCLPQTFHTNARVVISDLKRALFGFIRAQLILVSITAITFFIGLLILRVPYALIISLAVCLVDFIPYIGVGAILLPWSGYCWWVGDTRLFFGILSIYVLIVIIRQVLEPRLVSAHVGINPLATLISIFAAMKLFGFLGLIVGPAIVVLVMSLYRVRLFTSLYQFVIGER